MKFIGDLRDGSAEDCLGIVLVSSTLCFQYGFSFLEKATLNQLKKTAVLHPFEPREVRIVGFRRNLIFSLWRFNSEPSHTSSQKYRTSHLPSIRSSECMSNTAMKPFRPKPEFLCRDHFTRTSVSPRCCSAELFMQSR